MSTTTAKKPAPKASTRKSTVKPAPAKAAVALDQPEGASKAKASKPEPKTLIEALTTGQAVLVKIRANKTVRSLPYLAPGSDQRKQAETVAARVKKGETLSAIAEELNVSLATARRFLTNLSLAHDVEAGKHDKAWTKGTKQVIVRTVPAKA
jgi:DNA invertase Pin-like site-specific DNA recombinase